MTFFLYKDSEGKFRWRLYLDSGHPLAEGVEGYETKPHAMAAILQVRKAGDAKVDDHTLAAAR